MLTHGAPGTHWLVRFMPLETLSSAQALALRLREVDGIRAYVNERMRLVLPALLVMVFVSIACAIGVVVFLADRHTLLTLLGFFCCQPCWPAACSCRPMYFSRGSKVAPSPVNLATGTNPHQGRSRAGYP